MDIIVCGAQVPFTFGGAELHVENLVRAFQAEGHRAELVRLPVAWEPGRLFDTAAAWRLVPLDADVVVATNFPSYFARHDHKVVWLFHQHRGAYDAADTPWSGFDLGDESLEVQRLLGEWDCRALEEAERLFTTSGVVADRLLRYNGLRGRPLAHPPPLHDRLHPGPYGDYVFCATRLAANKRPELMVEAMASVSAPVRLEVAGSGALEADVRGLVGRLNLGDRVSLLGHISDDDLIDRYANALAAVYVPFDEDYGYVTLQAFLAAKPVITAKDAGGVLEWVEDGVTGIVTDGSPEAVGDAIDLLAAEPGLARRLGEAGRDRVAGLAWGPVVDELLGQR